MSHKTDRIMCGTCQYWTGRREPIFDRNGNAKISISDAIGNCECTQSSKYDQARRKDLSCKNYYKWTELL